MSLNKWNEVEQMYFDKVTAEFAKEKQEHIPSGKLSASMLPKPLLWQVLKTIGVPQRELDIYVLMTFDRGRQVEDLFMNRLPITDRQKDVSYRGVVGKIDGIITVDDITCPLEVKSVKYMKFKRIEDDADEMYILQATLYGLALKTKYVSIAVIDTQSGTPKVFRYLTNYMSRQVEGIIDAYDMAMKRKQMPVFEARYKWQEKADYQDYPQFTGLTSSEIIEKLQIEYPEAYQKWNNTQ